MNAMTRSKRAELAGGIGALTLGIGLGVTFGGVLRGSGTALLVAGGITHALGMWDKHRLERHERQVEPRWVSALYWLCWLLLAALPVYLLAHMA